MLYIFFLFMWPFRKERRDGYSLVILHGLEKKMQLLLKLSYSPGKQTFPTVL